MLVHSFMVYNCVYALQPPYMRFEISEEYTQKLLFQGLAVVIFVLYCAYSHSVVCQFDLNIKQMHIFIN